MRYVHVNDWIILLFTIDLIHVIANRCSNLASPIDHNLLDIQALVDLQLHTDVNVRFAEKAAQVAELIAMFTKSVAETPFK